MACSEKEKCSLRDSFFRSHFGGGKIPFLPMRNFDDLISNDGSTLVMGRTF